LVIRVNQVLRTVIDALKVLIAFMIVITTFFSATADHVQQYFFVFSQVGYFCKNI
jgi:hypothetical protein